jgi:hypothetical protein
MTKTMKAGVVRAFGKPLSLEEVPIPTPGPGEILIKVIASGICHTDLHAADGDWPVRPALPFVPGHEGVGIIAACGPGVAGFKEGDRRRCLAARRVRPMRVLYDRLGQFVSRPAQHRLQRQWQLRGVCDRRCSLCGALAGKFGLRGNGTYPLCRGYKLQRHQRNRRKTGVSGWQSRESAALAILRCNTQRRWACMWRRSISPTTSSRLPALQERK